MKPKLEEIHTDYERTRLRVELAYSRALSPEAEENYIARYGLTHTPEQVAELERVAREFVIDEVKRKLTHKPTAQVPGKDVGILDYVK